MKKAPNARRRWRVIVQAEGYPSGSYTVYAPYDMDAEFAARGEYAKEYPTAGLARTVAVDITGGENDGTQ